MFKYCYCVYKRKKKKARIKIFIEVKLSDTTTRQFNRLIIELYYYLK